MKRRTFLFKKPFSLLVASLGFGTASANASSDVDYKNYHWKVTTTIKFPREMTKEEFVEESKKWTDNYSGKSIFNQFEKEGKIISAKTIWEPGYTQRIKVFKSYQDGIDWENACKDSEVKKRGVRDKLGYRINVETEYIKPS